ncbi:MAG: hypothetical protein RL276_313 [Bacteroidota bacterium]
MNTGIVFNNYFMKVRAAILTRSLRDLNPLHCSGFLLDSTLFFCPIA